MATNITNTKQLKFKMCLFFGYSNYFYHQTILFYGRKQRQRSFIARTLMITFYVTENL
jgi:hypothetical protein